MKIEILYPEICTLYGDKGNTMYLQKCLPDAEFVTTGLNEKPLFLKENIDMVYMCSMSEKSQELVLDRLMQYKDEIAACMKDGKALFLLVGNSMELLGDYIKREEKHLKQRLTLKTRKLILKILRQLKFLLLQIEILDVKLRNFVETNFVIVGLHLCFLPKIMFLWNMMEEKVNLST